MDNRLLKYHRKINFIPKKYLADKLLSKLREELAFLQKYECVVYGSYVSGQRTSRSDVDIAVITREKSARENQQIWRSLLGKAHSKYDIKVFELLPLQIQIAIADNNVVLFGDRGEISEYFYQFYKIWRDVKPRFIENQFSSFKEKIAFLRRAKAAGY